MKTFVAKLAQIEDTTILPVFFSGQNSISYMLARKLSQTLGYSLMFRDLPHDRPADKGDYQKTCSNTH